MQCNSKTRFLRMAALSVAAFVFCFALVGATHEVYGSADKKTYNKAYKALRKGVYEARVVAGDVGEPLGERGDGGEGRPGDGAPDVRRGHPEVLSR